MEEQKLKELIEKTINKGWVFYGEFNTDVATQSVLKLLKEQLHIPVVVRQSEQLFCQCEKDFESMKNKRYCPKFCEITRKAN